MPLLDRVTRLIRADINHLAERAEDPEKLLRQLLLDMENQRMQLKTQVAISVAELHVLEKRRAGSLAEQQDWMRKAELVVREGDEELARDALERSIPLSTTVQNYREQIEDVRYQVDTLKGALAQLERKLEETRKRADTIIARDRRVRLSPSASPVSVSDETTDSTISPTHKGGGKSESEKQGGGKAVQRDDMRLFEARERAEKVDQLLTSLRAKMSK